jgi:hypothetical protein
MRAMYILCIFYMMLYDITWYIQYYNGTIIDTSKLYTYVRYLIIVIMHLSSFVYIKTGSIHRYYEIDITVDLM